MRWKGATLLDKEGGETYTKDRALQEKRIAVLISGPKGLHQEA